MLYCPFRKLTIITRAQSPKEKTSERATPDTLALAVLGWILAEETRAERLLALTGLTPEILRERLDNPDILSAILEFLLAHEPDLLKAADALHITPEDIVLAHESLNR